MHQGNSLCAPVIDCDDHNSASNAAPQSRHHLRKIIRKHYIYQIDSEHSRIIHNHPSGDPTPSRADIQMTKQIIDTAKPLGIAVHDHIIVGRNGHASLKGLQLI